MKLASKVGLPGGVALVVGGVIGMGVYVMIPSIAAKAGAAVWLSITIALVVSLLSVLPLIQISSALPVAGGGYMWCSRMLHPLAGIFVSWWALVGGAASVCVVASGLADLLMPYVPFEISIHLLAALLILAFYLTYFFGIRLLTTLQLLMSVQLVLALAVYAGAVLSSGEASFELSMPHTDKFGISVILAFNVCLGFQIITEMGEDMKNPKRNIPLALALGSAVILIIYLGISVSYLGTVGIDNVAAFFESNRNAPLMKSAEPHLSPFWLAFLGLGGIFAGLTSFNAGAIALPRELFSQARDKTIPSVFAKLTKGFQSPLSAVSLFFGLVILQLILGHFLDKNGVLEYFKFDSPIDYYGVMAVCGIMLLTVFISLAAWRLPTLYPEHYKAAYFKLSKPVLYTLVVISVLTSLVFVVFLSQEFLIVPIFYSIITTLLVAYYFYRKNYLANKGIKIGTVHNLLDEADQHHQNQE